MAVEEIGPVRRVPWGRLRSDTAFLTAGRQLSLCPTAREPFPHATDAASWTRTASWPLPWSWPAKTGCPRTQRFSSPGPAGVFGRHADILERHGVPREAADAAVAAMRAEHGPRLHAVNYDRQPSLAEMLKMPLMGLHKPAG